MTSTVGDEDKPSGTRARGRFGFIHSGILVVILAVAVYGALLFTAEAEALRESVARLGPGLLLLLLGISSLNFVFRYFRWHHYLHKIDAPVGRLESLIVFLSGFSMTLTPAKAGEVLKSIMLKRTHGIPITRSAPVVLAERVSDLCGLMILMGLGALVLPNGAVVLALTITAVAFIAWVCASDRVASLALRLIERIPLVRRAAPLAARLVPSLHIISLPSTFLYGLVLSVIAWGMQCLMLLFVANSILPEILTLWESLLTYAAPLAAGNLASLPGGLGVSEGTMTGMLVHFGAPRLTVGEAAVITLIARALTLWWALLVGYASLAIWRIRFGKSPTNPAKAE